MSKSTVRQSRILVVDDEPFVCDSIQMLLTFDGHAVKTANNAAKALEIFDPSKFDLLITDYAMPGMQGTELAKAIRQIAPGLPVILVTAYAEMLDSWQADLSEIDCVVSKPFRLEDLRQAVLRAPTRVATD